MVNTTQALLAALLGVCGLGSIWGAIRKQQPARLLLTAAFFILAGLTLTGPSFDHIVNQGVVTPTPLAVMQWLAAIGFFLIGVVTIVDWLRFHGRPRLLLAGSIGLLGGLALFGQIWLRYSTQPQPTLVTLVLLLISGFFFFLFRSELIPARRTTIRIVASLVVVATAVGIAVPLPANRDVQITYSPLQGIDLIVVIGVWAYCVGEPCFRLWFHSRKLPAVQRMRARFLALGYGGIIAILVIAVPLILVFQHLQGSQLFTYGIEAVVLASQPLMYFALFPPSWLRRIWRETEEERFRQAIHQLLVGQPDAKSLATECLDWAVRLVGAEAGCIVGLDGQMLATSNLSHEQALMLAGASHHEEGRQALRLTPEDSPSNVIIIPMHSDFGSGAIAVVAGRFTPVLGSDEVNRLSQYAASVTAAFDRLIMLDRVTEARAFAEQASERKSEHLSRMSHELRTPMSAILGFAELLSMNSPREDQKKDIDAIVRAGEHLLALINDVLEIALIESGGGLMSLEPVGLETAISESIELIARRAEVDNINLDVNVHSDTAFVLADNQRLRQVLVNLLSNAVKYNRTNGSVTVVSSEDDGHVRIEVADTGLGIAQTALERLFQPFDRIGQERTHVEGTGLGLALSKALVDAMHGTIGFESEEGIGSKFWVELPRTEAPSSEVSDSGSNGHRAPSTRAQFRDILYVEDNLVNVELVDRVLAGERPQLNLITASSGTDALHYLEDHHPGMIFLDLHLGDINGDQVLRWIRANPRLTDIPVVMLSADAAKGEIERLTLMGANEYLTKPFRIKTLLRVMDDGLAGVLKSSRVPN